MIRVNCFRPQIIFSILLVVGLLVAGGCSSSEKFSGFSYDPEGAGVTTDKEISLQYKHAIGISADGVWVSNEFEGARMNNFYKVSDSLYRIVIEPENYPINNSPWYSFKVWSDTAKTVDIQLTYKHGKHRYRPDLSSDGRQWRSIKPEQFSEDTTAGTATLTLQVGPKPLWVSAQELLTLGDMQHWADSLAAARPALLDTVGYSHFQRPILRMRIGRAPATRKQGVLIVTGRQHPPEVTGGMASKTFIETITADTELARKFRKHFEIWAYPLLNPDGVQQGHWRHNGAGIDLNRDWKAFNQPETQSVRDDLAPLKANDNRKVYYGIDFHSTNENIFYPINRDISTFPEDFTYRWIDELRRELPNAPLSVEPFDTSSPIAKNWIYHTFGADAVTYEVNDAADRERTQVIARKTAQIIMRMLLKEQQSAAEKQGIR